MLCACAILSSVTCVFCNIFAHYPINGTIFEKKLMEHKMCVSSISTTVSETFFILRRTEQDMIKTV